MTPLINFSPSFFRTAALLRKLQNLLHRSNLLTLSYVFVRLHLDYGNTIYDEAHNTTLHCKLESVHFDACLAIKSGVKENSKQKFHIELVLPTLTLVLISKSTSHSKLISTLKLILIK